MSNDTTNCIANGYEYWVRELDSGRHPDSTVLQKDLFGKGDDPHPFRAWKGRPKKNNDSFIRATHIVVPASSVQEVMILLSRFFTLRYESAEVVKQLPSKGTFTVVLLDKCASATIKVCIFWETGQNPAVVEFCPREHVSMGVMSGLLARARKFIRVETESKSPGADNNNNNDNATSSMSTCSETDIDLDDNKDVASEDEWQDMLDNCADDLRPLCNVAIKHAPTTLLGLARILRKDMLASCWTTPYGVSIAKLLVHMAICPLSAAELVGKIDPLSCPYGKLHASVFTLFTEALAIIYTSADIIDAKVVDDHFTKLRAARAECVAATHETKHYCVTRYEYAIRSLEERCLCS